MSMFRMGTKYEVPHMRDEALRRLESRLLSPGELFEIHNSSPYLDTVGFIGWPISVVNLARSFDLPRLLPGAFYLCTQLSLSTLVHGFPRADGGLEKLSADDLIVCLEGRDRIITRNVTAANSVESVETPRPSINVSM